MFKRRNPLTLVQKLREMVWPSMGWGRAYCYYRHRIFRNSDSTHKITGGLALGAAVSFSPLIGTHIIQAVSFSMLLRLNAIAAFIGTAFCNPWTVAFIFWADYKIGAILFKVFDEVAMVAMPDHVTWDYLIHHPLKFLLPMLAGSVVCGIAFWFVFYILLYLPVRGMRAAYQAERGGHDYRDWQ